MSKYADKHTLITDALRDLSSALSDEYEYINWGGCAVMATIVGRALERIGIPCEVVSPASTEYWDASAPNVARRELGKSARNATAYDWDRAGLSRRHLALRFRLDGREYTWDSDGLYEAAGVYVHWFGTGDHRCDYPFGHGLSTREAGKLSRNKHEWNPTFDRRTLPALRRIVRQHFHQLKEVLTC